MSGPTYRKAEVVVEAAEEDPETFGPVADEMDKTGKVEPAYQKVASKGKKEKPPDRRACDFYCLQKRVQDVLGKHRVTYSHAQMSDLRQLHPEVQMVVAKCIVAGQAKTVRGAVEMLLEQMVRAKPVDRLKSAWEDASETERNEFLEMVEDPIGKPKQ